MAGGRIGTTTRPRGVCRAGVYGGGSSSGARPAALGRLGHQVESKVPGRCTGGISRTVGEEKA